MGINILCRCSKFIRMYVWWVRLLLQLANLGEIQTIGCGPGIRATFPYCVSMQDRTMNLLPIHRTINLINLLPFLKFQSKEYRKAILQWYSGIPEQLMNILLRLL